MNNLNYKIEEFEEVAVHHQGDAGEMSAEGAQSRPFLVAGKARRFGNPMPDSASRILDYLLKQGSMPA